MGRLGSEVQVSVSSQSFACLSRHGFAVLSAFPCARKVNVVVFCDTHDTSILIVDTYVTLPVSSKSWYTTVYRSSTKYRETAQVSRVLMISCSSYHLATIGLAGGPVVFYIHRQYSQSYIKKVFVSASKTFYKYTLVILHAQHIYIYILTKIVKLVSIYTRYLLSIISWTKLWNPQMRRKPKPRPSTLLSEVQCNTTTTQRRYADSG